MRKQKAQFLYENMSLIDDYYLTEAANYKKENKKSLRTLTTLIALAAAFSLFIVFGVGSMFMKTSSDLNSNAVLYAEDVFTGALEGYKSYTEQELKAEVLTQDQASLIWLDTESGAYYCTTLSASEKASLVTAKRANTSVLDDTKQIRFKVWVMNEDGTISSPELKDSDGNISYRVLFDYDPELVLSTTYAKALQNVLQ